MTTPAAEEQDSPLAAVLAAIADGQPVTSLQVAAARLEQTGALRAQGATWAAIGKALGGISGRQAKRDTHKLAARVKRETAAKVTP